MLIIGCDFHTRYQQIAMLDEATGELVERRLEHENGEAHTFYRDLPKPVRVGVEATGPGGPASDLEFWGAPSLTFFKGGFLPCIVEYSNRFIPKGHHRDSCKIGPNSVTFVCGTQKMGNSNVEWIGLSLSGGGFRATLFHLGVVRFLYEHGLLNKVRFICSVSGGSILAAHLVLNWDEYVGDAMAFDGVASSIIKFTKLDVRGRIIRRWLCANIWILPRLFGKFTLPELLKSYYADLYANANLEMLGLPKHAPDLHILSTSLTTGTLCKFTKDGFVFTDGATEKLIGNGSLPLSTAVAASSAFPPLFPPISITRELLNTDERRFDKTQILTDGGVYDNLGLQELSAICHSHKSDGGLLIASDAGGNFDWTIGNKYSLIIPRNVRATDILMDRVSKLVNLAINTASVGTRTCRVDIGRELTRLAEPTALPAELQSSARNVRTDLDAFSDIEIATLIKHGYSQARTTVREIGINCEEQRETWNPFGSKPVPIARLKDMEIGDAKRRRYKLFSPKDFVSWLTATGVLVWLVVLWLIPAVIFNHKTLQENEALAIEARHQASLAEEQTSLATRLLKATEAEQLGEAYWMGNGVPRDYSEALRQFTSAADLGNARAEANIGWMYQLGLGVPADPTAAMSWYMKAAEDGDLIANWNIGQLYEKGLGVPKNPREARAWYEKGAAKGENQSIKALQDLDQGGGR